MGYKFVRGPYILQETVGMISRYVAGATYTAMLYKKRPLSGLSTKEVESLDRRMNRLQEIMETVCRDLNVDDPAIQRFFAQITVDCEDVCLARLLTVSFYSLEKPGFRENAEEICRIWHELQERGAWIHPQGVGGLVFSDKQGSSGDLFDQVSGTIYPVEFQMKLYGALRNFDKAMDELVTLIEPYALRLEALFAEESWLFDDVEDYWRRVFETITPEDFLVSTGGKGFVFGAGKETHIAINMMDGGHLNYEMVFDSVRDLDYNILIIGSGITTKSVARSHGGGSLDEIGTILKSLGDKKRLEILQHLGKKRSYCHELADMMDINPGNMSRHLAALYHYGFIRQEREPSRHYYEADREALHNFFQLVEESIFSD